MNKTSEALREYTTEELEALKSVIDYSERMIFDEGQRHPYSALRRQAFTKTVVVQTENEGLLEFRLSSTPAVITPNKIGYATPHSPVGRLCASKKVGDQWTSAVWGASKVIETRLFERFDGPEFEPNVRNFLRMEVAGQRVRGEVHDLKASVQHVLRVPIAPTEPSIGKPAGIAGQGSQEQTSTREREVAIIQLVSIEDGPEITTAEIDEVDVEFEAVAPRLGNYIGLNEIFYVDRTQEQDQIMARSPIGPMFVEGIAGSGKTSAALGRTKMLCDFDARNVSSREEFEQIVGQNGVYWEARFAGQFSQESSVGFVRTGELIQYLRETCRRIDLPNLPILEFGELRARLRDHRQGALKQGGGRWSGAVRQRETTVDTTMQWLRAADRAIAHVLAREIRSQMPELGSFVALFDAPSQPIVQRVAEVAFTHCRRQIESIAEDLDGAGQARSGYAIEGIAARVVNTIQETRRSVLGRNVLWVAVGSRSFNASSERELAQQMVEECAALYLKSGSRLVWVGDQGLLDSTLKLTDRSGHAVEWTDGMTTLLDAGELLVRDSSGRHFSGKAWRLDDLYLALLPEALAPLYFEEGGKARRLRVERGLGRLRIPLAKDGKEAAEVAPDEVEQGEATTPATSITTLTLR